jgi:exodeoxyribonuclease V beta subunit
MPPKIHTDFDPVSIKLEKANLIEASAGTGKTYSIALLALRLIVEKGIPIEKILMVTFTRDAAAEMELRVRAFIREALLVARNNDTVEDPSIRSIIKKAKDKKVVIERLQDALAQFDKAAIFTIHGFCGRTLKEFAFESSQLFRSSTMEPDQYKLLLEETFNQCWRELVTTRSTEAIRTMKENKQTREKLLDLIKGQLGGKPIYLPPNAEQSEEELETLRASLVEIQEELISAAERHIAEWREKPEMLKGSGKATLLKIIENQDIDLLLNKIDEYLNKGTPLFINAYIDEETKQIKRRQNELLEIEKQLIATSFSVLAVQCCNRIENSLNSFQKEEGQITFDDMIVELHCAVSRSAEQADKEDSLHKILQRRYSAIFIDEFQDTDKLQYEIFSSVFQRSGSKQDHIVFYIGDPKQSIYAFRKADLNTYFSAREQVDHLYRMNKNYRSSNQYIQAMNTFFIPSGDNDVFLTDQISYYPIESPDTRQKTGGLVYEGIDLAPLRIMWCQQKEAIFQSVALLTSQLLKNQKFKLNKTGTIAPIQAGQIGILVRKNEEGQRIRKELAKLQIPAVTISDQKVFESAQATELYYILESVENISRGNINRTLLTVIAGYTEGQLDTIDLEILLLTFKAYQEAWKEKGVYAFLRQFLRDVQITKRQLSGTIPNGERVLADTFQLIEMLHDAEKRKNYAPRELIQWLKKGIEGQFASADQYLQRIESDENAVKIVTIHKSKGLEYDIVIAPFLDMKVNTKHETVQFHDDEQYYTAEKSLLDDAKKLRYIEQEEQEYMRLIYVAITRARYHCYVLSATNSQAKETALKRLLIPLLEKETILDGVRFFTNESMESMNERYTKSANFDEEAPECILETNPRPVPTPNEIEEFATIPRISIPDEHWERTSYSKLNTPHDPLPLIPTAISEDPYDRFIFLQLRKGALAGNLIHDLLERIDFSQSENWTRVIKSTLDRFPGAGVSLLQEDLFKQFLETITTVEVLEDKLALHQVHRRQRLSELEFDLALTDVNLASIPEWLEEKIPLRLNRERSLTGMLNGKIDLFFEHQGKYYIADWKSNHLGNRPEDYHQQAMAAAMESNNYHLQYYLYTVAVKRYLQTRMDDFDYETQFGGVFYLFIRGMRVGSRHGIYFHKPIKQDIEQLEQLLVKKIHS